MRLCCCADARPGSLRKGQKYHEYKNEGSVQGQAMGFTTPQSVLLCADRVIE
jgi:hypothetical protein